MRYLSVCSGIEAATVAWHQLGWSPVAFSQFDPEHSYKSGPDFPSLVLAHHYPNVPNLGDMTRFKEWPDATIDLLVGGTPCQSFSVAGLRKGLADPRGNLALTYLAIADRFKPRWIVWENVPGVLSSNGGRDFSSFIGGLAELGYGWAYRILDAQYFGVPQRRRRVFVVGYFGDWRRAAAVLFERQSLRGDSPPRRETGKGITASPEGIAGNVSSKWSKGTGGPAGDEHYNLITHALRAEGFDASEDGSGRGTPLVPVAFHGSQDPCVSGDVTHPVGRNQGQETCVAFDLRGREGGAMPEGAHDTANIRAASGGSSRSYIASSAVRRLTPRECERLQGFPSIREKVTMEVCLDRQNRCVSVALSCLRWQSDASPADAKRFPPFASVAESSSSIHQVGKEPLAAVTVHTSSVDQLLKIRSHGKLIWSANSAERSSEYHPPMQVENIAAELAQAGRELALEIRTGKAESLQSIRLSTQAKSGGRNAPMCGAESVESVRCAETDAKPEIFTTSTLGSFAPTSDSKAATSLCSVLAAISGCIQSETLPERFSLLLDLETPYTLISVRGKPAADGPRYKALGNSMAVPVMSWIGQRIQMVEEIDD